MKTHGVWGAVVCVGMLVALGAAAHADTITYGDFSDLSDFTLNGSAASINSGGVGKVDDKGRNVLRLTDTYGQAGSAFLTDRVDLKDKDGFQASFSTAFSFRFSDQLNGGADGIVFVLQTDANNVGGTGGNIGYGGIRPSVGIEFDNWFNAGLDGNSSSHVGLNINGSLGSVARVDTPVGLDSRPNDDWFVWIDYDGVKDWLEVRLNTVDTRPTDALIGYTISIANILQRSDAFIGFTSGTGAAAADHDIVDWKFVNTFAPIDVVPEPATLALVALGLAAGVAGRSRKRRARS